MTIIKHIMRYCIVENNGRYTVFGRTPDEMKSFDNLVEAETYYDKITNSIYEALANAPSWD